ncbi:unnamed protein product [Calypogeia fissa]
MGQTVSLPECVTGGSVVRVMKTDGEFSEFDFPCIAAEVMVQHPGHIVVHCTAVNKNNLGQRTKITIVLPDKPLLPGQPYMLYPIPDQYKKSLGRSKSFSMLKTKFESTTLPPVSPAEKRQGRRKALKLILTRLNLATYVASNINESSSEVEQKSGPVQQPPKEQEREEREIVDEESEDKMDLTVALPNPVDLNFTWRPILSTIPESPLGFHSRPESPLGLYKMDDGIPHSPLAVGSRPLPPFVSAS